MPAHVNPAEVRLLALDVDGVLTDGSIMLDDLGHETKRFNVRDGLGITTWLRMGFQVAIITKRSGEALKHRARELGIRHIIQGCANKGLAIGDVTHTTGIPAREMAFIGDDWPDIPAMRMVGFPIAVADAAAHVKAVAAHTTTLPGGRGAVREAIEHLLTAKGMLDQAVELITQ